MSYGSCTYTAQGSLVCEGVKRGAREGFVVREDTNEKEETNQCVPISKAFVPIANIYNCDVNADVNACDFSFRCDKPGNACGKINRAFSEIAVQNGCSIDADNKACKFSYKCPRGASEYPTTSLQ